jgi:hypothetical protein
MIHFSCTEIDPITGFLTVDNRNQENREPAFDLGDMVTGDKQKEINTRHLSRCETTEESQEKYRRKNTKYQ